MTTAMSKKYFIGIDDTDFGESIGTGALARELQLHLVRHLNAVCRGITRHQLLIHPDIPYTSHNSSACIELDTDAGLPELATRCEAFIEFLFHDGADPGLCVVEDKPGSPEFYRLGLRTTREIITREEVEAMAASEELYLRDLGGTGLGIIGALAACALRMSKQSGRYILLRGIRGLAGTVSVAEILHATDIEMVVDQNEVVLDNACMIETNNWVRPVLRGGRIILAVARCASDKYLIINKKREDLV